MSTKDPTDSALAAIASIRDNPQTADDASSHSEAEKTAIAAIEEASLAPEQADPDSYDRIGPGPMAAIRFKWSVRRGDDGDYFVDETIGASSAPVTSGPMSREAAVKLVDERESEARRRFDDLRSEMAGRAAIAGVLRDDGNGEA